MKNEPKNEPLTQREDEEQDQYVRDGLNLVIWILVLIIVFILIKPFK